NHGAIYEVLDAEKYLKSGDYASAIERANTIFVDQDVCINGEGPGDPPSPFHDTSLLPKYADIIADVAGVMGAILMFLNGAYH
ncbi:pectinesterase inhibitor 2-like, partial [Trifolium medium]|nr:pectinesterase inhibitor 2-like [Trifolium medium]